MNSRPTRLSPEDRELWEIFERDNPEFAPDIKFDVRVGEGFDPGPSFAEEIRRDSVMLTQRRIDVVCTWPEKIWLMEITHTASLRAIGQMEVYPFLFMQTFRAQQPIYVVLMYRHCDADLERYIQTKGLNTVQIL